MVSNGDITSEKVWDNPNRGSWVKQIEDSFVHDSVANPGYENHIANTIGPLLYLLDAYNYSAYNDYTSKTVVRKTNWTTRGVSGTIIYDISVDGSGKVSATTPTGSGISAGTTIVFTYY
jgi:L-fucose isomerase-like protein